MALMGCDGSGSASDREPEALAVEYGGCDVITTDPTDELPTCVLETERLHLWIEDPEAERAQVWLDDERVEPERYRRDDLLGLGLALEVPTEATSVRVVVDRGRDRSARWSLRLSHEDPPQAVRKAIAAIVQDANDGLISQAQARLQPLLHEAPRNTDTLYAALAVADALVDANELPHAESLLNEVAGLPASKTPYGRAQLANSRGNVLWRLGRLDEAAIAYREAARYGLQVRDAGLELAAPMMYSELLVELGYLDGAAHWAQHVRALLDERPASPGDVAAASRTLGWIGLLLHAAGRHEIDPKAPYRKALALRGPGGAAEDPTKVGGVRIGLARAALDAGRPDEALNQLREIDTKLVTSDEHAHALELEIRARLRQGADAAAVAPRIDELEVIAKKVRTPQVRWQVAVLRGHVAERGGEVEAAIEHYRRAEQLHDEVTQRALFGVGRSTIGALGSEATQRLVDLLVRENRLEEALCTARLSRARALRPVVLPPSLDPARRRELDAQVRSHARLEAKVDALEAEARALPGQDRLRQQQEARAQREALVPRSNALFLERGRLSAPLACEDLTPRAPGELMLALHPVEGGLMVLVEDDQEGLFAHRVEVSGSFWSRTPQEQSSLLLEPVRERLLRARRTRVSATGEASDLDVHALPLDGAPLLVHTAVGYAVELPAIATALRPGPPTALLIADATGSLWAASPEIQAAGQHLRRAGWSTQLPDSRSLLQVRGELAQADLFHYAGHAYAGHAHDDDVGKWPPYAGGAPHWPSYLLLEPTARLRVHEILMLSRAPRWVVLNGCRTGVFDVQNAGISLALAFLAAGSQQVLASPENVDDLLMEEIGRRLYDGLMPEEPLDLTTRVQQVLRARVEAGEPVGRVRVWVR